MEKFITLRNGTKIFKKTIVSSFIVIALLSSSFMTAHPFVYAGDGRTTQDGTETDLVVEVDTDDISNETIITAEFAVTPHATEALDALSLDVHYSENLQPVQSSIETGNLFQGGGAEVWIDGEIIDAENKIDDMLWSVGGSNPPVGEKRFFCRINFTILGQGDTYIQVADCMPSYQGFFPPSIPEINSTNFYDHVKKISISNPQPPEGSNIGGYNSYLSIDIDHYDDQEMDILWYSNISGSWKMIGWNMSEYDGTKEMSSYGIVSSPYNATVSYDCGNLIEPDKRFYNNTCPGNDIGTIKRVFVEISGYTGKITPYFFGSLQGEAQNISGSTDYAADITYNNRAPAQWTWSHIRDLDIKTSSLTSAAQITIVYDKLYGQNISYWWKVAATDGVGWENETFSYETGGWKPTITDIQPQNGGTPASYSPTLSARIEDPFEREMNITFYRWDDGEWDEIAPTRQGHNGTYTQTTDHVFTEYDADQHWKLVVTCAGETIEREMRFITRDMQEPPIDFLATAVDAFSINLSWTMQQYTDEVLIRRSTEDFPEWGEGTELYENDGDHTTDISGVSPGTVFYYSAWAHNNTDDTYSTNKTVTADIAYPLHPNNFDITPIEYNEIEVEWEKGSGAERTVIVRKIGEAPASMSDGEVIYNDTGDGILTDTEGVGGNLSYYYRIASFIDQDITFPPPVNTTTLVRWSQTQEIINCTTPVGPPSPVTPTADDITETNATLNFYLLSDGGEEATCGFTIFDGSETVNYTSGNFSTGDSYHHTFTNLTKAHAYTVQAWGKNAYGMIWSGQHTFHTDPYGPINLQVDPIPGNTSLAISWDLPPEENGIDRVRVRVSKTGFPQTIADGQSVYSGNETSFILDSLNENIPTLHERYSGYHTTAYPLCPGYDNDPWKVYHNVSIYDEFQAAQTFTVGDTGPNEYFYLTSVRLRMYRTNNPGPVYVAIRNASTIDGMHYTYHWADTYQNLVAPQDQYNLGVQSFNGYDLPEYANSSNIALYHEIEFDEPIVLKKDHSYAIVVYAPFGSSENAVKWVQDHIKAGYGGGDAFRSTNDGATWNEEYYWYSTYWGYKYGRADFNFALYGTPIIGLDGNTTYYVSAWGYDDFQHSYSEDFVSEQALSNQYKVIVDGTETTNREATTATVNAIAKMCGESTATCGFKYGTSPDTYPNNVTAPGTYGVDDEIAYNLSGLSPGTTYYVKTWSINNGGYYEDMPHTFITKPAAPLDFTVQEAGARQLSISWTKAAGQDTIVVVRKVGSAPVNMTDGFVRYTGNGTSFNDTNDDLSVEACDDDKVIAENTQYYYSAWAVNETTGLNSTAYASDSDITEQTPTIISRGPLHNESDVNTIPILSATVDTIRSTNITFWRPKSNTYELGALPDDAFGTWAEDAEITNTGTGYATTARQYCDSWWNKYWDRKFAYKRMHTSGHTLNTGKITGVFDHPQMMSGIYLSYGKYSDPPGHYTDRQLEGTKTWYMEYHDYYADEWIVAEDNASWGDHTIDANSIAVVDQVRVWMISEYSGDYGFDVDVRLNYVRLVHTTDMIGSTTVPAGGTGQITWDEPVERGTEYYYAITIDDGKTVVGSNISSFITEDIKIENVTPANGGQVGVDVQDHTVSFDVNHTRGESFDIDLDYARAPGVWQDGDEWYGVTNGDGPFTFNYQDTDSFGATYYWRVTVEEEVLSNTQEFSFTVRNQYTSGPPTMTVSAVNATAISFTDIQYDSRTDWFEIRYDQLGYPDTPADGLLVTTQSGTDDIYHNELEVGATYYYSFWGYNETDQIYGSRGTGIATTEGPNQASADISPIDMTRINLTNMHGNEYVHSFLIYAREGSYVTDMSQTEYFVTQTTGSEYIHTDLDPVTIYNYTIWTYDAEHDAYGAPLYIAQITKGPSMSFNVQTINSTAIKLYNMVGNEYADKYQIRYSTVDFPPEITDGTLAVEEYFTVTQYIHNGLSRENEYFYSGWAYNETYDVWSNNWDAFGSDETPGAPDNDEGRTDGPITLSDESPATGSSNIQRSPTLSIHVDDYEDNGPNDVIFTGKNNTGQWETIATYNGIADGTVSTTASIFNSPLTTYEWQVHAYDGVTWTNSSIFTLTTTSIDPPLTEQIDLTRGYPSSVSLSWEKNPNAERTIVMENKGSPPSFPSTGAILADSSAESGSTSSTLTDPGAVYYYRFYSAAGVNVGAYLENKTITPPEKPVSASTNTLSHRSIDISWVKGTGADYTYIVMQEDYPPLNTTDGTVLFNASGTNTQANNLSSGDHLNYFTVRPDSNTIGTAPFEEDGTPGPFNQSADYDIDTNWDMQEASSGTFTYTFNQTRKNLSQERAETVRLFSGNLCFRDFYNMSGVSWNSAITKLEAFDGTWETIWSGETWNTDNHPEKEWWATNRSFTPPVFTEAEKEAIEIDGATKLRYTAWTDSITPDIIEVQAGKLGYTYHFALYSVAVKDGLVSFSMEPIYTYNGTDDAPNNHPPDIGTLSPADDADYLDPYMLNFSVDIGDKDEEDMNIYFQTNRTGSWENFYTVTGKSNGTHEITTTTFDEFSQTYYWRVRVQDTADVADSMYQTNWNTSEVRSFTVREAYIPTAPSGFDANATDFREITLSWSNTGAYADETYIVMKAGSEPANKTDGIVVFENSEEQYVRQHLEPETTYYFKAWGKNATDNTYSESAVTAIETTGSNRVPNATAVNPTHQEADISRILDEVTASISDPDGDDIAWEITGTYITTRSGNKMSGDISAPIIPPLPGLSFVYWTVHLYDGYDWNNITFSFYTQETSPPYAYDFDPYDGETDIPITQSQISFNISDPEGELMTWSVEGDHILTASGTDDPAGRYHANLDIPLPYDMTITWYINITDGIKDYNRIFSFETENNHLPVIDQIYPPHGSGGIPTSLDEVSVRIRDQNDDQFDWRIHGNYLYVNEQEGNGDTNGTYTATTNTPLPTVTEFTWHVDVFDGTGWTNETYTFNTTDNNPPHEPTNPTVESRTGYGKNYTSVYDAYLNTTVSDPDGNVLDVAYYLNGRKIGEVTGVSSGSTASLNIGDCSNASYWDNKISGQWEPRNILNHSTAYDWYVEVSDATTTTTGPLWEFTTSHQSDCDESGRIYSPDVSKIVVSYGDILDIGGGIGADIDNSARVYSPDISTLITGYGDICYG